MFGKPNHTTYLRKKIEKSQAELLNGKETLIDAQDKVEEAKAFIAMHEERLARLQALLAEEQKHVAVADNPISGFA